MLRSYIKIAWRNLLRDRGYSLINILGLASGMAVAMLVGLWIWDELSFDHYHTNYKRIAQVMQNQTINGQIETLDAIPTPLGGELRAQYGSSFTHVVMASWTTSRVLTVGDKIFKKSGIFIEPDAPAMFSLKMLNGSITGLHDLHAILLAQSVAHAYFGEKDPVGRRLKLDNKLDVRVMGVYEDLLHNSSLAGVDFLAPWQLYIRNEKWLQDMPNPWNGNTVRAFVQLADQVDAATLSAKIKDIRLRHVDPTERQTKPALFLHPMARWHLYSNFNQGVSEGGRIRFVWLLGFVGGFVLLLACINFMNLATARSERRAKEIGIRKAIGSVRFQLISQFFSESFLVVTLAFLAALIGVQIMLAPFNQLADKALTIPWMSPAFWSVVGLYILLTGLIAGSYPALYLSSFQPLSVLKGTFQAGYLAAIPRKVLVVVQFTVSIILIVGALVITRQLHYSQNRPVGYDRSRLLMLETTTPDIHTHLELLRTELKKAGAIVELAESGSPTTAVWWATGGYDWPGKDPQQQAVFSTVNVSPGFGRTVDWKIRQGHDFSSSSPSDSSSMVLNEAAIKFMGLKAPVGQQIQWNNTPYTIIGVVSDMVMESPYEPVRPTVFFLDRKPTNVLMIRLNPTISVEEGIHRIQTILKSYSPSIPFDYKFVDQEYAKKFGAEQRMSTLISFFSGLAIFISCLGLFGLASFVAERRTKEIGIRKVLGAGVLSVWQLLSREFTWLVVISLGLAVPIAYLLLSNWLASYAYHTDQPWWLFTLVSVGTLFLTLLTVSYQAIKAALVNPVKSLRAE